MEFQRETSSNLWEEIFPLLQKHYDEIAKFKDIALAPDIDTYNAIELAGNLRCYTVRKDGEIIGYAVFMVHHNLHYRNSLQAVQDVVYLDQAHRGGRTGLKLLRYAEDRLKSEGVEIVMHHVKPEHPALGTLLEFMGYEVIDIVYARKI